MTGLNESTKPKDSSKRFGKNHISHPTIQTNKNSKAREVIKKKMKRSSVTDMYQTNTLKKVGQIGKHTQNRNPTTKAAVIK